MKWIKCLLALGALLIGQVVYASSVYAASDYDDVIKVGGTAQMEAHLPAAGGPCQNMSDDISDTWWQYVRDRAHWYNAANANTSLRDAAITAFNDAVSTGKGWALVQNTATSDYTSPPSASSNLAAGQHWLTVYYSSNSTAVFQTISNQTGFVTPELAMKGSWYKLTLAYTDLGNGDCGIGVTYFEHHTADYYGVEAIQTDGINSEKAVFVNFNIPYPEGVYEGEYPDEGDGVPTELPPTPVTTLHNGTIDCGAVDPVAMIIEQPYNDGSATLTPTTVSMANWSYSLTSSPYRAGINCGGEWIYTPYVDPVTIDDHWVCNIFSRPAYCS